MFITTNTKNRTKFFSHEPYAKEAIDTLYRVQGLHPFFLYAFVIMPDHCHFLIKVPAPERISRIMGSFKRGVSHNIGVGQLWQTRFHLIIPDSSSAILSYIHWNPVKAGLVKSPLDYSWGSASGKWDVSPLEYT